MNTENFDELYHRAWQSDSPELADQVTQAMNELPSVEGRMEMSHGDFQQACQVLIREFQQDPHRHSGGVIQVLCEAVRCSRECCNLSSELQSLAASILEKAKSQKHQTT